MSSETDQQFVERISLDLDLSNTADIQRLFALARRGAAVDEHAVGFREGAAHMHKAQADRIAQLEADNTRLRVENIQMQAALGYAICAEDERHIIPSNPFKCGVCDARIRAALDTPT